MKQSRRNALKAGAAIAAASAFPRFAIGQGNPVKIGMSMPQTGSLGAGGQAALLALRMWVDEVNVRGGLKIPKSEIAAIMGGNAARLLKIDYNAPQRRRS